MNEEVYNCYYDTAWNFHWTGTSSGEHTVKIPNQKDRSNRETLVECREGNHTHGRFESV